MWPSSHLGGTTVGRPDEKLVLSVFFVPDGFCSFLMDFRFGGIFKPTSAYDHFGLLREGMSWEVCSVTPFYQKSTLFWPEIIHKGSLVLYHTLESVCLKF